MTTTRAGTDASTDDGAVPPRDVGCTPATEECNRLDDDCDGQIDEQVAAQADCERRIVNAKTICQSGLCVRLDCLGGFYNCDGIPENGCESSCECSQCAEADSGSAGG